MAKGRNWKLYHRITPITICFAVVIVCISCLSGYDHLADDKGKQLRFQQEIGGIGMGAVMAPAWNFSDYDPRLQTDPLVEIYPIPSGYSYSPDRLSMVSSFNN